MQGRLNNKVNEILVLDLQRKKVLKKYLLLILFY